ncbi:MAG: PorV/PorQ family protein [Candidatus Zixiibacteriota bacterium]
MLNLRSALWSLVFMFLVLSNSVRSAVNSNAGTSAFPFLKIDASARAVSMGGAFTGLANDESALYYNPAGIAHFEDKRFIASYHNYFVDMQSGFLGFIKPLSQGKYFLGLHISYLNYGKFIETDNSGTELGEFSGSDLVLAGTVAFNNGYAWKFGATTKIIYEKIHDYSASGLAFDIGAKYSSNREYYSAGIMIQNLGFQFGGLGDEKDKLPLTIRGGGSARLKGMPLTVTSDIIIPTDNDPDFAFGGEYAALKPFYIRLGWNTFGSNYQAANSDDNWAGLGLGFGFDFKDKMHLAYAFTPGAELGDSHRITLSGGF